VKRYLVPMVLNIWIVSVLLGLWIAAWLIILIPVVIVQVVATVKLYRRDRGRFK
jgi:hypothetical protein